MRGVDLERDDLIYFKADETIREAVLGNDEAGTNAMIRFSVTSSFLMKMVFDEQARFQRYVCISRQFVKE